MIPAKISIPWRSLKVSSTVHSTTGGGTGGVGSYGIVFNASAAAISWFAVMTSTSMLASSSAVLGATSLNWYARSPILPEMRAMLLVIDANWLMVLIVYAQSIFIVPVSPTEKFQKLVITEEAANHLTLGIVPASEPKVCPTLVAAKVDPS